MSTQSPHHVSNHKSQNPHPPRVIPDPDRESTIREQSEALQNRNPNNTQKTQNEPNSRTPGVQPPQKNAKRTQFRNAKCPATPCFSKTNPISPTADLRRTKKCKTNPISPRSTTRKHETNPICHPINQKMRNKPNSTRQICQTNPIPEYQVSCHPLFQRNEPNLPCPPCRAPPQEQLAMR